MARNERLELITSILRDGAIENRELPFRSTLIGRFSGKANPPIAAPILVSNTDKAVKAMKPSVKVKIQNKIQPPPGKKMPEEMEVELSFEKMSDFSRVGLENQLAKLDSAFDAKLKELRELEGLATDIQNDRTYGPLKAWTPGPEEIPDRYRK